METGYLKMKDVEAIPLDQRPNILDHYRSGECDPVTITGKLVIKQSGDHVTVRLPRQTGKFIRIPMEDMLFAAVEGICREQGDMAGITAGKMFQGKTVIFRNPENI